MFLRLTLTYCTQGRSGTHFSFLEYKKVKRKKEQVVLNWKEALHENLLNMNRMHEDIDYLQMQSQLSFESGSSAGRSLQGYWFPGESWHQVEQSNFRSNLPWRQMVVSCWFCCGQVWSFSSSSTPWRPEEIFSQNNLDFGDFLISGLVASFPVLVLKCHPICLH